MGTAIPSCPSNAIVYNRSFCACPPGQLLQKTTNHCTLFTANTSIFADSQINYHVFQLPETIFSFDTIRKFTQSQAVFLEATAVMLLSWLIFCLIMRFMKLGDGKNIWFQIRWWISRLDICFSTRHWLDDQKVVTKRKTELGGTFSIASWILFIGLFAALLYQIISKRTIEVHTVKATNAPDLASFTNDMEFNITTVSSMSCSNLRGLGTLVTGTPGSFDHRVVSLSSVMNYTCFNTSKGPTVALKCSKCRYYTDYSYISWQFIDLPSAPATAVGFQFNLSARSHGDRRYLSFVSGTLTNGSSSDGTPVTFRGNDTNILKFDIFPRIYRNFHDLKMFHPLFHEFLPGSFFRETAPLQASLGSGGLINTTLYINYLSAYIIEVENRSMMGPVSFLADLGGLYCISISIFLYFLVQCEYRVKKLRNEDQVMRNIRRRLKAQQHWDKVRKFVMYTWDCHGLVDDSRSGAQGSNFSSLLAPSIRVDKSLHARELTRIRGSQHSSGKSTFNRKVSIPDEENSFGKQNHKLKEKSPEQPGVIDSKVKLLELKDSKQEHPLKDEVPVPASNGKEHSVGIHEGEISPQADSLIGDDYIPYPPSLELKTKSNVDMSDIKNNLQDLHDYNVMLREKFLSTQSLLHTLMSKETSSTERQT